LRILAAGGLSLAVVAAMLALSGSTVAATSPFSTEDLGVIDVSFQATAFSHNGQVVGQDRWGQPASWTPAGGMVVLGSGRAVAVNDAGQVAVDGGSGAFLWSEKDGKLNLGTLGGAADMLNVSDVSEQGQVVGAGQTAPGPLFAFPWHAFSWTRANGMVDL